LASLLDSKIYNIKFGKKKAATLKEREKRIFLSIRFPSGVVSEYGLKKSNVSSTIIGRQIHAVTNIH
jgi:hypothetical protein